MGGGAIVGGVGPGDVPEGGEEKGRNKKTARPGMTERTFKINVLKKKGWGGTQEKKGEKAAPEHKGERSGKRTLG